MISELLSSIILATNISSCVVPAATYAQGSSIVYTPEISESRINQNADDNEYHAVRSNSIICMYCHGIVDKGIIDIPLSLLDRSIEGYYVHESGVKIYE